MEEKHNVELYYTTCTIGEATHEINCMLEEAGYLPITDEQCIDINEAECEEDWFEDYNFTFLVTLYGTVNEIKHKLFEAGLSFEVLDES